MMKRTATVQANFDFDDEATAADKLRTAYGVTSIVTALAAASPLGEGRPNGYQSYRAAIWLDTDPDRCGLIPSVFEPGFGFRHYVEWALDVPMFFVVRDGVYHDVPRLTFRRFMSEGWQGQRATMRDWETHLSTLFPEVRLKRFIEVRGADAGPLDMMTGIPALWRGLMDDREACLAAWRLVSAASLAEREALRREVPRRGLAARFRGHSLRELAVELCRIAADGLARLPGGGGDIALLESVRARAESGRSPADDMLDDFAACKGDRAQLVARWDLGAQAAAAARSVVDGGAARI
jgi:glutamate--cysteine ligase